MIDFAAKAAALIRGGFNEFNVRFRHITQRAAARFALQQWDMSLQDNVERIGLYDQVIQETTALLRAAGDGLLAERALWAQIKICFSDLIEAEVDQELHKTFYNSMTRRFFKTQGVLPDVEFVALDIEPTDRITRPAERLSYTAGEKLSQLFAHVLRDLQLAVAFANPARCAERVAAQVQRDFKHHVGISVVGAEFLRTVFYRQQRAYLVGRVFSEHSYAPIVLALKHFDDGVRVDAVLSSRDDVAALFGYTRSYFHADLETVGDAVVFLRTLLPRKPIDELYTVLGRAKQGKTERYRHFFRHLEAHQDQFKLADGERGMVMAVFTLPSYPLVFKVIRDRFAPTKNMVRADVIGKYQLVFKHDRAGRLVDAQEFRFLRFPRARFTSGALADLLETCANSVIDDGAFITITHLYAERRIRPLNLFVQEAAPEAVATAMVDYGQALKDLAFSGIFAGDMLLKNFGVTRGGRVIFYDYDELCFIDQCRFRELPDESDDDEFGPGGGGREAYVAPNDMFPEEFPRFLGLTVAMRTALMGAHADLFTASWWSAQQASFAAGKRVEIPPYPEHLRLNLAA
jgi:isocitrate dehydrogenase kinase/phosphatase